ncbi:MAG: hypothetical protein MJZ32_09275 [Bacteroidaceae bacterium]|nr:hypothetical protein [Bacteroidaceae bacterium]
MTIIKQKSNVLLLRMLFLLAMVLTGSSASWAQTQIAQFKRTTEYAAASDDRYYLAENNGVTFYALGLKNNGAWNWVNNDVISQKNINGVQFVFLPLDMGEGDTGSFIKMQFASGLVKVGDVISVDCADAFTSGDEVQIGYRVGGSNTDVQKTVNNQSVNTLSHTLTASEIITDGANQYIRIGKLPYKNTYIGTITITRPAGFAVTFGPNTASAGMGTVTAKRTDTNAAINSGDRVPNGTKIQFTATPSSDNLHWGWDVNGTRNWGFPNPYTVTEDVKVEANFTPGIKINAYPNNGTLGSINITGGGQSGTSIHVTPYPGTVTFTATPNAGAKFVGWYSNVEMTNLVTTETTLTYKDNDPADDTNILRKTGELNRWAKFESVAKPLTVTANWQPIIPANAAGWGLTTVTVKANGADVDASKYTLEYEVVNGPLQLDGTSKNATVTSAYNKDTNKTAKVRVTATPTDGTYTAGSCEFDVNILPVAKPNITVTPSSKTVRVGEKVTLGVTRDRGFSNPQYTWTLSDNAKTSLYGYSDPITETQASGADDPSHTFVAKAPTSSPISVNLKFSSNDSYFNGSAERGYEQANVGGITVKPVTVPTITEDASGVHFTYEKDYGDVEAYLQYFIDGFDDNHRTQVGFGTSDNGTYTATGIAPGKRIYAQSVVRFKYPSDATEWTYVASDMIPYVMGEASHLPAISLMMQPRYKNGNAKRYIPIGVISELNGGTLTPLESQWPEGVVKGEGAITNYTMGYLLGNDNAYPVDKADKGVCISRNGKAQWAWTGDSSDPNRKYLPKTAAFYMDVAGTMDIVLFAENTYNSSQNSGNESDRRYIKVSYLNDQCTDGKPIELKSWGILGNRAEGNYANGGNGAELRLHIRLPQLGTDGKTTLFFTYETDANDTDHDLWIKGFMIQRPDLTPSIGRTDAKYSETRNSELTGQCVATANTPYVWSFEPKTTGHSNEQNHKNGHDAVGFRPASTTDTKKTNEFDGRTYICGEQCDHLLVYCDNEDEPGKVAAEERPEFDGRSSRNEKSHLELVRPTVMAANNGNADLFNPIKSNGLKVNVTGSGWFKVWASAPNGAVKMKFLTSTNGGMSKIRVLKEFTVASDKGSDAEREVDFQPYTAYLKAQVTHDNTYDAVDATGDPEAQKMSLYVVFEAADGSVLTDGKFSNGTYPQLNIHKMSWLNEEPVIYNFQREENPALLTTMQKSSKDANPDFYWQMGTSLKENDVDTYDINDQTPEKSGQESTYGKPSNTNSNGGKGAGYQWNTAAPACTNAHTEAAYANGQKNFTGNEYVSGDANNKLEFGSPISGSFLRICAMKNSYIVAHFVQSRENGGTPTVYVMDETGKLVPYCSGADTFNETNLGKFTTEARMRGCVSNIVGLSESNGVYTTNGEAFRIDIIAPAGKEFFICANNGALSLARLESLAWRIDKVPTIETDGELTLADGFDNSSAINTAMSRTGRYAKSVTLIRTFTAGNWASLVLPFSMNEKKLEEVFGEGTRCIHFTDVDKTTNTVHLTHHFYNMIVAGRPVFICPANSVTNPVIKDVTLSAKEVTNTVTDNGFTFFASYDNSTMNQNDLYMNNANAIKYLTVATKTYPGLRSFIKSPAGYDPSKPGTGSTEGAKAVFLNFDDSDSEEATGIETLISEEFGENVMVVTKQTKVYDLNGRVVANGTDISNLPSGVYIVNGKKYVK